MNKRKKAVKARNMKLAKQKLKKAQPGTEVGQYLVNPFAQHNPLNVGLYKPTISRTNIPTLNLTDPSGINTGSNTTGNISGQTVSQIMNRIPTSKPQDKPVSNPRLPVTGALRFNAGTSNPAEGFQKTEGTSNLINKNVQGTIGADINFGRKNNRKTLTIEGGAQSNIDPNMRNKTTGNFARHTNLTGKVAVKDKSGNVFHISSDDLTGGNVNAGATFKFGKKKAGGSTSYKKKIGKKKKK
jgi:hypothetical protein|tara:strand:- start:16139 stop:16861 length:723 start_codon:yes stop_codon:yes gene_type:complete